jgi:Holliday junction resolvase
VGVEKRIESAIKNYLQGRGYFVIKIHGNEYQMPGLPDILAIRNGKALWIEVKRPAEGAFYSRVGGKLSAIQLHRICQLRKAGCLVIVATSLDAVKAVLGDGNTEA